MQFPSPQMCEYGLKQLLFLYQVALTLDVVFRVEVNEAANICAVPFVLVLLANFDINEVLSVNVLKFLWDVVDGLEPACTSLENHHAMLL
jgi:hypothetical protein